MLAVYVMSFMVIFLLGSILTAGAVEELWLHRVPCENAVAALICLVTGVVTQSLSLTAIALEVW